MSRTFAEAMVGKRLVMEMRMAGRRKLRRLLEALLRPAPVSSDYGPSPLPSM